MPGHHEKYCNFVRKFSHTQQSLGAKMHKTQTYPMVVFLVAYHMTRNVLNINIELYTVE